METTMYDNLLQLPLFQGLCKDDFTTLIEKVKLHFITCKEGETIAAQDEICNRLLFILDGEVTVKRTDKEHHYSLTEQLDAPHIIELYSMFGMYPTFKATYKAKTEVKLLSINKPYIYNELHKYEIVRINYLNLLSNTCQSAHRKLWNSHHGTMEAKIAHFLTNRCLKPQGEKVLHITMEDLGNLIDETRMNVSRLLNELQQNELLQLRRKEIYIPSLEKLTAHLL